VLEQKLATGCFLLQAVLLVEYFVRTTPCSHPLQREARAQEFVRAFYAQRCGTPSSELSTRQQDLLSWRGKFAVQLHTALASPNFAQLQSVLVHTCVSTLRTLHRAWHPDHLPFFIQLLEHVANEHLGNAIVGASIRHWTRQSVEAALEAGGADALLDEFRRETQRVRRDRSIAKPEGPAVARIEPVKGPSFSLLQGCVNQLTQQPQSAIGRGAARAPQRDNAPGRHRGWGTKSTSKRNANSRGSNKRDSRSRSGSEYAVCSVGCRV